MQSLLKTVTGFMDQFAEKVGKPRLAAIIGGEAVILHGIPRTTIDLDILFFCEVKSDGGDSLCKQLETFIKPRLSPQFSMKSFFAAKDLSDPLKHDLIIITDSRFQFKKLDILIANYDWEVEGLNLMGSADKGPLQPYPKPYLVAMKLMAGGAQDQEDIRNLFLIMPEPEKEKSFQLSRLIRRDNNLSRILSHGRRNEASPE